MSAHRVVWCDRGWLPVYFGFCPSERAWRRELKRLGVPPQPYPVSDGRCTWFAAPDGKLCALVTIAERIDGMDPVGLVGLLVHEAAHVWQKICEDIGEDAPSMELEAYALQNITLALIEAYRDTRPGLARKRWAP